MTTGLTLQQLFSETTTEQFIVPEIQRDYVWESTNLDALLASLRAAWEKSCKIPALAISGADADAQLQRSFLEHYRRQRFSHHLGFVYAYHDSAYPAKAFLIDGQQRLLSLYLLVLARAVKEKKQDDFRSRYLLNRDTVRLDYRVREATHDFLQRFVDFVLNAPASTDIEVEVKAQYWYFQAYDQDETIAHILRNYGHLAIAVQQDGPDYEYLNHFVRFWYFDTGDSARGEDLYLSLNSTGLMTSPSENQRAFLLGLEKDVVQKKYWGGQIERWQGFFWKRRGDNANSDKGFNEFFRWLRVLGPVLSTASQPLAAQHEAIQQALGTPQWSTGEQATHGFNLANAQRMIRILERLYPHVGEPEVAWLESKWLRPEEDTIKLTETFRLLPVLAYCLARPEADSWTHLQRVVRYFYNLQRLPTISKANSRDSARHTAEAIQIAYQMGLEPTGDPAFILEMGGISSALLPAEEAMKMGFYGQAGSDRAELEELLWELEDDAWNDGEVAHLFQTTPFAQCSIADVRLVSGRYKDLQLHSAASRHRLQSLFLFYGDCSVQDKYSGMYEQYDYGSWRLIVRNQGKVFSAFFSQFLAFPGTLEEFHSSRIHEYYNNLSISDLWLDKSFDNQLRILAVLVECITANGNQDDVSLWAHGSSIGYFYDGPTSGYEKEPEPEEMLFGENTMRFWNTSDRLTSAYWRKAAVSHNAYQLFKERSIGINYRLFVEEALVAVGARQYVPMLQNKD